MSLFKQSKVKTSRSVNTATKPKTDGKIGITKGKEMLTKLSKTLQRLVSKSVPFACNNQL